MVWDHIPKDEIRLMQGVWALEEARARALERTPEKKQQPPETKPEDEDDEFSDDDPYELWEYGC